MIAELNNCATVRLDLPSMKHPDGSINLQQIKQANEVVTQAAELSVKYRKNVLYNLEASGLVKEEH